MPSSLKSIAKSSHAARYGLARVLSKMGACSRSQAEQAIREGRVRVDGRLVQNPEQPIDMKRQQIILDGVAVVDSARIYLMLNKPRGVVVSAADEQGRNTVYDLLKHTGLPWLGPVGRLDRASEGLLLLSNDTEWAAGITQPVSHLEKVYHVQVQGKPDATVIAAMLEGIDDTGERLKVLSAVVLRGGDRNTWLEVVLDEGRNRHIRRLMNVLGYEVLRLVRVAIGPILLGELGKGQWRHLNAEEVDSVQGLIKT